MFEDDSDGPPAKRTGLARMISTLARKEPAFDKIGAVVASGAGVHQDARKLAVMLASYGEGDRMGKYAFSSTELAGAPARTLAREVDDRGAAGFGTGSLRTVATNVPATEGSLGISAPRLQDAVAFLKQRGWAKTTDDGEFAPGTDFHEVSLTAEGRSSIQHAVAGGSEDVFGGMPGMGPAPSVKTNDRDAMMAMYARAKVNIKVEHDEASGVTVITVNGLENTFDAEGALIGTAKAP